MIDKGGLGFFGKIGSFGKGLAIIIGLGTVILSIVYAIMVGFNGGGWDDLMWATGGRIFDSDRDLSLTVEKLKVVRDNPSLYDSIDVDSLKSRIFFDLGVLVMFFYVFLQIMQLIWTKGIDPNSNNIGVVGYLIIIVIILGTMSLLHVGWLVYESKVINDQGYTDGIHIPEAIPFYGVYNFISNYKLMGITGTKGLNLFEENIQQTNETINPNVVNIVDRG